MPIEKQTAEITAKTYMDMNLSSDNLYGKDDLLQYLLNSECILKDLLDYMTLRYTSKFEHELYWRYPIGVGDCNGAYLVPVKEGLLCIPYNEVDAQFYEILLPDKACILDAKSCQLLINDIESYTQAICNAIRDACSLYGYKTEDSENN